MLNKIESPLLKTGNVSPWLISSLPTVWTRR
jgi:hypothetical protein